MRGSVRAGSLRTRWIESRDSAHWLLDRAGGLPCFRQGFYRVPVDPILSILRALAVTEVCARRRDNLPFEGPRNRKNLIISSFGPGGLGYPRPLNIR